MKTCGIHDLIRDLCLKEAEKERFLSVIKVHDDEPSVNDKRRIVFHEDWSYVDSHRFQRALQSSTFIRSLSCDFYTESSSWELARNLNLLRVLTARGPISNILQHVNLRYLKYNHLSSVLFSSMHRLRYLQTLILYDDWMEMVAPNVIWEMPQLRHLIVASGICLPDPLRGRLDGQDDCCVLKNLQTLCKIMNFKCTEEVLKRIPNIKKLSIEQDNRDIHIVISNYYCLRNLGRLQQLQSLRCDFVGDRVLLQNVVFPQSLKKLTLRGCRFDRDDITTKAGSLPHLEKLRLDECETGDKWNTVEGKFLSLKFLEMKYCDDLKCWTADSAHFPLLERLFIKGMIMLEAIPSGIVGDTLRSIKLEGCYTSVVDSARAILEEQQSLGNEGLRLTVI